MPKSETPAGTALAKPTISPKEALLIAQQTLTTAYKQAKANAAREFANIEARVGGSVEQLDATVIEQGRRWAQRLTLIARRNAGSNYSPNKSSVAIQAEVKKIFGVIGSLEAIVANDVEIPLFGKVSEEQFFGDSSIDIRRFKPKDLDDLVEDSRGVFAGGRNKGEDPAELRSKDFLESLLCEVDEEHKALVFEALGDRIVDIPPEEDEQPKPTRKSGRRAAATPQRRDPDDEPEGGVDE